MISNRILISTIVVIFLVQCITGQTTPGIQPTGPAATKTEVKARISVKSKSPEGESANTATKPTDVGMNPNEDTAAESEKPTSLRQKLFKPIKSMFWPIQFLWGKFKILKNKVQNRNKTTTASESSEKM